MASIQKEAFLVGENLELKEYLFLNGKIEMIRIERTKAITPPNLLGMDRRIAYANKKYHSGWIWMGVFKGLAGLKFSGSPIEKGAIKETIEMIHRNTTIPKISLIEKKGWNIILSAFLLTPVGEFEPFMCKEAKWIIMKADRINGKRKWIAKNRFNVACPTENPPHNHWTIKFPIKGIAETKFVITVAPQNDICPHGRTYPMKAVPIKMKRMEIPDIQVSFLLKEEKIIPRLIWIKIIKKKKDAPFIWKNRSIHPSITSRVIWMVEENAKSILAL